MYRLVGYFCAYSKMFTICGACSKTEAHRSRASLSSLGKIAFLHNDIGHIDEFVPIAHITYRTRVLERLFLKGIIGYGKENTCELIH